MLKVTEQVPPEYCAYELIERLKEAGIKTDGHIDQLIEIITENGFKLPSEHEGRYGFIFLKKYTMIYINFVDACANEILMLHEYKMLKTK